MQKDVKINVTINSVLATKIEEKYQTNLSHAVLCVVLNVIREENYILPIKTSLYDYLKSFGLESINANREVKTIRINEWCLNVLKRKISLKGSPIKRRNFTMYNEDALALIQKPEINSKNTILVLDPPYPKTEYVYDQENAPLDFSKKHTILADYLAKDFNGKFIFFCRITGPKGEKDREKSDIAMEYTIDCFYRGKGFYCIDTVTEYDENGRSSVIERIITNFAISHLEGARAYE